jgi:Tfp pilus assembly protein FimT
MMEKRQLNIINKEDGYNMIEILFVAGIIMTIIVIAGSMSSKFAARRSMDNMTRNLSSTLQLAKLNAVRQGVEYRAVLASCAQLDDADPDCAVCDAYDDYDEDDDTITITIERGDSNRGSTNWCVVSSQTRNVQKGMALDLESIPETDPRRLNFNPNGSLVDETGAILAQQIDLGVEPTTEAKITRCGRITVTPFGRIGIIEGNWDGTNCNAIGHEESSPSPSP